MLYLRDNLSEGNAIKISDNTTTAKTMAYMIKVANHYAKDPFILSKAAEFMGANDPIRAVFDFAYSSAVHRNDESIQFIKTPLRTIDSGQANCVSYSVLISSLLSAMQIPHYFRAVDISGDGFKHIYIKTKSDITLDCTSGQAQDDTDTQFNRSPTGNFNKEVQFLKRLDQMPELYILNGSRVADVRKSANIANVMNGVGCNLGCDIQHPTDFFAREQCKETCEGEDLMEEADEKLLEMSQSTYPEGTIFQEEEKDGFFKGAYDFLGDIFTGFGELSCYDQCGVTHAFNNEKKEACRASCAGAVVVTPTPGTTTGGMTGEMGLLALLGLGFAFAVVKPEKKKRKKRRY